MRTWILIPLFLLLPGAIPPPPLLAIDIHEHVLDLREAERLLIAMEEFGIEKTCLMGTSKYTFTLDDRYGFEGYQENNKQILKIAGKYPDRFAAFWMIPG